MTPEEHQLQNQREVFCIRLLSRGVSSYQIANLAEESELFLTNATPQRVMARHLIRRVVNRARRRLREAMDDDPIVEAKKAYNRLKEAYMLAAEQGDTKGMVLAQKEINAMLGLKKSDSTIVVTADKLYEQLQEMRKTVP